MYTRFISLHPANVSWNVLSLLLRKEERSNHSSRSTRYAFFYSLFFEVGLMVLESLDGGKRNKGFVYSYNIII